MDLESLVSSLFDNLPENVSLDFPIPDFSEYIPTQVEFISMLKFLGIFSAASLLLGLLGRIFSGRRSGLSHAVSSSIGILFIYAATIVIYTFRPWQLDHFLSPLPFVAFSGEYMSFFSFLNADLSSICYEILSVLILAFLVNLLDTFISEGESVVGWYFLRLLTVFLAMLLHFLVRWVFSTYLPDVLITYAPMILLGFLIAMLLLGALKILLSIILTAVEPIIGAIYTFFFSNIVGKQVTKAVITTLILCALAFALEYFGVTVVCISQAALLSYIPMIAVLLILWYLVGHIL